MIKTNGRIGRRLTNIDVKALTFDTGGAILNWHSGISDALAAADVGFKTAFVRRPDEWGAAGPPDPDPSPTHDIIADDFPDMARQLDIQI